MLSAWFDLIWGLWFQVVSVTLDDWSDEQVDLMEAIGGNALANSVYENFIPSDTRKPPPDASVEERSDFIRSVAYFYEECPQQEKSGICSKCFIENAHITLRRKAQSKRTFIYLISKFYVMSSRNPWN